MSQQSSPAVALNQFQRVAEALRKRYEAEEVGLRGEKETADKSNPRLRAADWGQSVMGGFVDDLADFTDFVEVKKFVIRRRDRFASEGMGHGANACTALLQALGGK